MSGNEEHGSSSSSALNELADTFTYYKNTLVAVLVS